jgi:hypothetical protein
MGQRPQHRGNTPAYLATTPTNPHPKEWRFQTGADLPQRHAIGDIFAAAHDVQLTLLEWRRAMTDLVEVMRQDWADDLQAISAEIKRTGRPASLTRTSCRRPTSPIRTSSTSKVSPQDSRTHTAPCASPAISSGLR